MRTFVQAVGACWLVAASGVAFALEEPFHQMSAEEIRRDIVGRSVTDEAHWWDVFLPDGVLRMLEDGTETLGRWSLEGEHLCFTFPFRGHTAHECFEVWRSKDLIDYRRDGSYLTEGLLREFKRD